MESAAFEKNTRKASKGCTSSIKKGTYVVPFAKIVVQLLQLQHPLIGKTKVVPVGGDDDMIEDLDIEELGGPLDLLGNVPIRLAGL